VSLLAAFAFLAAQGAPPVDYRAVGTSPLWLVTITPDSMTFSLTGREMVNVTPPPRQETELGFAYSTQDFGVAVAHADCTDALTGRTYRDTVTVRVGAEQYQGCGGPPRGANPPARYDASGSEPFWWLEIADGRIIFNIDDQPLIVRAPRPLVTGDGGMRRYNASGLSVLLRRRHCEDEGERTYADMVTVTAGDRTVEGCGGRVLREAPED
jgi:uncharacterized membrane protein